MGKRTLYVSDLDGALLRSDGTAGNYVMRYYHRFV